MKSLPSLVLTQTMPYMNMLTERTVLYHHNRQQRVPVLHSPQTSDEEEEMGKREHRRQPLKQQYTADMNGGGKLMSYSLAVVSSVECNLPHKQTRRKWTAIGTCRQHDEGRHDIMSWRETAIQALLRQERLTRTVASGRNAFKSSLPLVESPSAIAPHTALRMDHLP